MSTTLSPLLSERARLLAESESLRYKLACNRRPRKYVERKRAINARLAEINAEIKRATTRRTTS